MHCKGKVVAIHQCSGCLEVVVDGKQPGAFSIDNCLVPGIIDMEGAHWIGRKVEYLDGYLRFLPTESRSRPSRSSHHV